MANKLNTMELVQMYYNFFLLLQLLPCGSGSRRETEYDSVRIRIYSPVRQVCFYIDKNDFQISCCLEFEAAAAVTSLSNSTFVSMAKCSQAWPNVMQQRILVLGWDTQLLDYKMFVFCIAGVYWALAVLVSYSRLASSLDQIAV